MEEGVRKKLQTETDVGFAWMEPAPAHRTGTWIRSGQEGDARMYDMCRMCM